MKERLGAPAEKEALAFIEGVQTWENTLTRTVTPRLTPKPREEAVQSGSSHQPSRPQRRDSCSFEGQPIDIAHEQYRF